MRQRGGLLLGRPGTLDTMGFGLGDDVHVPMAQGALDTQAFLSTLAADEGITTTGTKG